MQVLAAPPALPDAEVFLLVQILNGAWGAFFPATPALLAGRLASRQLFVVGRGEANPAELAYVRATYGLEPVDGVIPLGILETIDADTGGDPARVPVPYAALTTAGRWREPLAHADTLVFVDLTTATSRQRSGLGRDLVAFALGQRAPHHRHVYTYTPDVPALREWHRKRGARETGVVLKGARPGHSVPDVALMDYSAATPADVA